MTPIIVQVTTSGVEEAEKIAYALLEAQLAVCVNLSPEITSLYVWQGKIETSTEVKLSIKTSLDLWPLVGERVRELHSYKCPEILALPILGSDPDYLKWWQENLKD
jgi:periplasmic divalent cation tolerance protein